MRTAISAIPTPFYYNLLSPCADEYPFDRPAKRIFEVFCHHNWDIPGCKVEFVRTLTGKEKVVEVRRIIAPNFMLEFSRSYRGGGPRRALEVGMIHVGKKAIQVFEDSGTFVAMLYRGNDEEWERDKAFFLREGQIGLFSHSNNNGLPIKYFESRKREWREASFVPQNLRYGQTPEETFPVSDLVNEVAEDLQKVASELWALPCPEFSENAHLTQELIEFKSPFEGDLFAFCEHKAQAHLKNIAHEQAVDDAEDYGLSPDNATHGLQTLWFDDWKPEWGYDLRFIWHKFIWAFESNTGYLNKEETPWQVRRADLITRGYPVKIKPRWANNIFVIDESIYWKELEKFVKNLPPERTYYDITEAKAACRAIEASLIPITEYKAGQYKQPLVLIGRELGRDEVELLTPEELEKYKA
jgi:hypothetical protein